MALVGLLTQRRCVIYGCPALRNNRFHTSCEALHVPFIRSLGSRAIISSRTFPDAKRHRPTQLVTGPCAQSKVVAVVSRRFATEVRLPSGPEVGSETDQDEVDEAAKQQVTLLGLVSNLFLSGVKGAAGYASGSVSLVADAAHSVSDLASDFVTLAVVKCTSWKADEKHPYGYGKYEQVGTLCISSFIVLTAAGIFHESLEALFQVMSPESVTLITNIPVASAAILISIGIKEALYHVTVKVGRECNSPVLVANAWHHRSDAWSSVVAGIGIGGSYMGLPLLDPVAGFAVAGMIGKMGVEMGWDAMQELVDSCTDKELIEEIHNAAVASSPDVLRVHNVRCRRAGPMLLVDLHAVVPPRLSMTAGYHTAGLLRRAVVADVPRVLEVLVHLEPEGSGLQDGDQDDGTSVEATLSGSASEIENEIRDLVMTSCTDVAVTRVMSHFLRDGRLSVELAIMASRDKSLAELREIGAEVKQKVKSTFHRRCIGCHCVDVVEVDVRLDLADGP
eukprot:gnl/MRDRNA2_/MRDRNA2_74233_c0_seq1.p1 gnl/MRDRNA2_/MRDRNA2_74233_c0~~gnl/MRDRNA2_/MRDRNA2_74233_c0_seq1.p1  ORF type:complete len:506 (+),score=83.24 gnl/MRDRNA2_/MRDRNA2_74233_c0_seq1:66-1583(+)